MGLLISIFRVIVIVVIVLSLLIFVLYIRPSRFITKINPVNLGLDYESVQITTSDGINLAGWFVPAKIPSDEVIILCHGYPADKNNILGATAFLAEHFNLFYFDFRYLGESEGAYSSVGYHEQKRLEGCGPMGAR